MFFFLHSLKGSCFIHLVLQSGPKWPMTRCRTLCGEKEIHKTRWVGWTISSDHHNLSIDRHQKKTTTTFSSNAFYTSLTWYTQHVCLILSATNLFSGNVWGFFFVLAYMELFNEICLSAAFYMLHHKNAFVLWTSQPTLNTELPRILSINVCLAEYINTICLRFFISISTGT